MDKIWLDAYQEGVKPEINIMDYTSLVHFFEDACHRHASHIAYSNFGNTLTYAQLNEQSLNLASFLQGLGFKPGTRVAIMMPNILQYPVALFAILRAGCVVVNVNPLYTPEEIIHQLNDAQAELIIVLANFADKIQQAFPKIASLKHIIITEIGDLFPVAKRLFFNTMVKYIQKKVPDYVIPQAVTFRQALVEGKQISFRPLTITHDHLAFLQYTGGTTGVAKGAMLTHGNVIANVLQASTWLSPLHFSPDDIIVTPLPLYHIFSLTANCLCFLKFGAKNILITNPKDLNQFIKEIKHSGFTTMTGVNTLFNALLNHHRFGEINFSKVKLILSGGMALQKSVAEKWEKATQRPLLEGYGLSETSPAITIAPMYLEHYNGSIGLPLPSTEVSIRDNQGQEVPIGESGELCVKGPQVMKAYWQHPEETAFVFTADGFLKTGDIVRMDEQGFLYIVDRKKDMIIVSGFNVYPNEIEQVIAQHPGVLEVGVVGVKHEDSGERVKACIVKKNPDLTKTEIIAHCRAHLTSYKVPKIVEFYEELPKSSVGKILRRNLKPEAVA